MMTSLKSEIKFESYYFRDSIESNHQMFKLIYYIPVHRVILSQWEPETRSPSEVVGACLHELNDARCFALGDGLAPHSVDISAVKLDNRSSNT